MRIDQLTFTRFLAALVIVILHFGKKVFPFDTELLNPLVIQGNYAVSYFYILSGFIMVVSYAKYDHISSFDYYRNRLARIYPIYLLGLLLYLPIRMSIYPIDFVVLFNIAALQSWVPGWAMTYNFPGWSISVEMFFYAIFPLLANHLYRHKKYLKVVVAGIILIWIATQIVFNYLLNLPGFAADHSRNFEFLYYFPLMHLSSFLIGNLAGMYFVANNDKVKRRNYDLAIIALVVLLVLVYRFPTGINYHNGILGVIYIPFILLMSWNTGFITRLFNRKELVFLGEISYSFYIFQLPIFYYGKQLLIDYPAAAFWVSLAVLLALSSLSFLYVEKPLREKIRNFKFRTRLTTNVK
jgi:peptidoglycan/LPS O-acetylase OafA/YrhL